MLSPLAEPASAPLDTHVQSMEFSQKEREVLMNNTNNHTSSLFTVFLTGLSTGIALTLLLAPLSGEATRDLISRKVKDGKDWMDAKTSEAEEYVATKGTALRERAGEVADVITRA
jgi:gas vesicle protein